MIKEFIPFKEALVLKYLGFNEECCGLWQRNQNGNPFININHPLNVNALLGGRVNNTDVSYLTLAPLYQQAFKFFREKFGKNAILFSDGFQWTFDLRWVEKEDIDEYPRVQFPKKEVGREMFDTYEEAEVACLRKLIELCS